MELEVRYDRRSSSLTAPSPSAYVARGEGAIVAAAIEPGVVASEVAREAGIHTSQLFRWRQQLCRREPPPPPFNAVAVVPEPGPVPPTPSSLDRAGVIEIEFAGGGRMRITGSVPAPTRYGAHEGTGDGQRAAMIPLASGARAWPVNDDCSSPCRTSKPSAQ